MIKETITNSEFIESIDLALVVFCQQHKRDIPLQKMIEGNGNVEGNANKYLDAYGVPQDCKYEDNEAFNKAVDAYLLVDNTVNEIIIARNNGKISSYISTFTKHGAAVFYDKVVEEGWESFNDVPEGDRLGVCVELIRRQIIGFNQVPEKITINSQ
ncbi:hypothetical protein AWW68_18790 [Roseivirga spongicola]|uniref:Uncharacterized protein n=1 Tax=Roseivirga spongicola TaxID=333140 RepID=A0A150XDV7_9BACT|nr:hypothetical protein [Roseivirga spongicola]KYG76905.1 hypothetical protein AWW68_18790 [Roseivirga spongicola]